MEKKFIGIKKVFQGYGFLEVYGQMMNRTLK